MPHLLRLTFVCLLLLAASTAADAQQAQSRAGQTAPTPLIDLDFNGGPFTAYVEALARAARAASPDAAVNVVLSEDVQTVPVPPLQLRGVTVESALRFHDHRQIDDISRFNLEVIRDHAGAPIYRFDRNVFAGRAPSQPAESSVWSLKAVIESDAYTADAVLSAVETAVQLQGDAAVEMRFHEDTGLLLAHGDSEALVAIDAVIDRLRGSVAGPNRLNPAFRQAVSEAAREKDIEIEMLRRELDQREDRLLTLQAQLAKIQADQQELMSTIAQLNVQLDAARQGDGGR